IACRLTQGNFPAIVACRWFFVEQGFYVLHRVPVRFCTVLIDGVSRRGFVVQWTGGCQIGAHPGDGHLSLSVCYRDDGAADTGFARGVCAPWLSPRVYAGSRPGSGRGLGVRLGALVGFL